MTDEATIDNSPHVVLITGPSGAGRSTAVNALEDIGYEVIDNLPMHLLPRLLEGDPPAKPLALGIDARNRDFSTDGLMAMIERLRSNPLVALDVLFLDCSDDVLLRRFSETRRRHPLAPSATPRDGIEIERQLLIPIRGTADILIDTTEMSPHDLRADIERLMGAQDSTSLSVTVQSFSYKRGLPRGLDLAFDCRFLRNPHWEAELRRLDGRNAAVADYVRGDLRFEEVMERLSGLAVLLLPAYQAEGKSHLSIGFGCTGGQHRSVVMTEMLAATLADAGWQVSKRHRELERRNQSTPEKQGGSA